MELNKLCRLMDSLDPAEMPKPEHIYSVNGRRSTIYIEDAVTQTNRDPICGGYNSVEMECPRTHTGRRRPFSWSKFPDEFASDSNIREYCKTYGLDADSCWYPFSIVYDRDDGSIHMTMTQDADIAAAVLQNYTFDRLSPYYTKSVPQDLAPKPAYNETPVFIVDHTADIEIISVAIEYAGKTAVVETVQKYLDAGYRIAIGIYSYDSEYVPHYRGDNSDVYHLIILERTV